MTAAPETAWGHIPALRYRGYTSEEYGRLVYEITREEVPASVAVTITDQFRERESWFSVRVNMGHDTIDVRPEDVVLWLPSYTIHIKANGEAYAYFPHGMMMQVITERMLP